MAVVEGAEAVALWRNRDYVLLWMGQVVSSAGTAASGIAFPLLVLAATGSAAQAGIVAALERLPFLLLSLPAGVLVDRWDRKRLMIGCDAGRALALGSIPVAIWTGHLSLLQLYVTSLVEGSLFVFFSLAQTACLPQVVPRSQLPAVAAQNYISGSVASMVGPPLGGALYVISRALPFLADAVSYLVSVFSLTLIRTRFQDVRAPSQRSLGAEMREGMGWLWSHPLIRVMAFLTCGIWVAYGGVPLLLIVLAKQTYHASPVAIGLMLGGGTIGSLIGAQVAPRIRARVAFGPVIVGWCWILPCVWVLAAVAPNLIVLAGVMLGVMIVIPIYDVVQYSYRLSVIPDALQGRVNSVFRLIAWSGQPAGMALTGVLLQLIGPRATVLVVFALGIGVAVAATLLEPIRTAHLSETEAGNLSAPSSVRL